MAVAGNWALEFSGYWVGGSVTVMGQSLAVMNTKGGVGKSTVVMALAETLSAYHGKNVLVIDSDSQTSMSTMLMHVSSWEHMEQQQRTLVDYLMNMVLGPETANWKDFIASGVSDVEDARSVYLIPSHMQLSLFEREVSSQKREDQLRKVVRELLAETTKMFDLVIIDCPPGLSLLTECWLREVQYFIPPTKPDYLAIRGLGILKKFRGEYDNQSFADLLGVLINLKDGRIASEEDWHAKLMADPENRCFKAHIPRRAYIQRAADYDLGKRTYIAKYPGDAGQSIRAVTQEVLARLAGKPLQATQGPQSAAPRPGQPDAVRSSSGAPPIPGPNRRPPAAAATGPAMPQLRIATAIRPAAYPSPDGTPEPSAAKIAAASPVPGLNPLKVAK
jgi:chromosome partitioning protein